MALKRQRPALLGEPLRKIKRCELKGPGGQDVILRQVYVERAKSPNTAQPEGKSGQLITDHFAMIQGCFPRQPMDISSWISFFQGSLEPFCQEAYLVFPKDLPVVIIYIINRFAPRDRDRMREKIEEFGNDMTREVTSVLQGFMTAPICIVPVFVNRQELDASQSEETGELLQKTVDDTLRNVKRFIPYGRWLMTESKFQDVHKAATEVLTRLKAAREGDAANRANE